MPCSAEKTGVFTSTFGVVVKKLVLTVEAGGGVFKFASPLGLINAVVAFLTASRALEECLELNGYDVARMREENARLEAELERLRAATQH